MFQKILHFIKYNNLFALMIALTFGGAGISFAATNPAFQASIYSTSQTVKSVDNHILLSTDLDTFNFNLQINTVTNDTDNYYIDYSYTTLSVIDGVWQPTPMEKVLTVSKASLDGKDLGLYVAKELGDNINYELDYLKRSQKLEKAKGQTQKVVTIQYSGLVGKMLDPKDKVIRGYQPVIPEPAPVSNQVAPPPVAPDPSLFIENTPGYVKPTQPTPTSTPGQPVNQAAVISAIQQLTGTGGTSTTTSTSTPTSTPPATTTPVVTPTSTPTASTTPPASSTPDVVPDPTPTPTPTPDPTVTASTTTSS